MSEDTGNSAPSLTQALVPPEIEATRHGISFFCTTYTSPDASASVLAGDAAASAPPATEDAIVPGITDDAHGTTPALPALPTHQDGNSLPKSRRTRMSYANKCVRANKSFFLLNGDAANMIPQDVYLNGKIIAVPRKGVSSEYKIVWDTTTIAEPPNKEDLRVAINRDDIRFVRELKNARMLYDSTSSSSDRGSGTISESNRRSARMENSRETRQSTNSGQDVVVDTGRMVSRLRMNPILMSTPTTNNNLDLNGNENNDSSESEEEDNMHGFHKDDECFTGDDHTAEQRTL